MFYTQPNTFIHWLSLIVLTVSISLIVGTIFWDIPNSDSQLNLNDRLGYHYSVMCVTLWPVLLLLTLADFRRNKTTIERDIKDNLYGRMTYVISKTIINLFPSLFVWLIYLVPSYSMCGLYMQNTNNYNGFYIYLGVMLLYLSCIQIFITMIIYLIPSPNVAVLFASLILTALFLSNGYTIHFRDINIFTSWLEYVSPPTWILPYLASREYTPEAIASSSATILCRNKQVST